MSKVTHTPGPWHFGRPPEIKGVNTINGWFIGPERGRKPHYDIGEVYLSASQNKETQEANARLIAAAPDLLEALVDLLRETSDGQDLCAREFVDNAKAAIEKATA